MKKFDVLIVGGGSAGITVAARLRKKGQFKSIAIIEPSQVHYYQPLWTLAAIGIVNKEMTARPMRNIIPKAVTWLKEKAIKLNPDDNTVETNISKYTYKYLIIATGIKPVWNYAKGLEETIGKNNVCSIYTYETVGNCLNFLKNISSGNLIFTMPKGLLKCGGAPQKIMWLVDDYCRRLKDRSKFEIIFKKEGDGIFGIPKYKKFLETLIDKRNISANYNETLVEVKGESQKAFFKNNLTSEVREYAYDFLHVVPHFKTDDFIISSALSNIAGEVEVNPHTLQSTKYKNVFSLGDCSSCPTGKTGAAVRKQAPVLVNNLVNLDLNLSLSYKYDGYTACPILTRHNRVMLAEFDYEGNVKESFPFNQAKESYLMYLFKRYALPWLYWNLMLKGRI